MDFSDPSISLEKIYSRWDGDMGWCYVFFSFGPHVPLVKCSGISQSRISFKRVTLTEIIFISITGTQIEDDEEKEVERRMKTVDTLGGCVPQGTEMGTLRTIMQKKGRKYLMRRIKSLDNDWKSSRTNEYSHLSLDNTEHTSKSASDLPPEHHSKNVPDVPKLEPKIKTLENVPISNNSSSKAATSNLLAIPRSFSASRLSKTKNQKLPPRRCNSASRTTLLRSATNKKRENSNDDKNTENISTPHSPSNQHAQQIKEMHTTTSRETMELMERISELQRANEDLRKENSDLRTCDVITELQVEMLTRQLKFFSKQNLGEDFFEGLISNEDVDDVFTKERGRRGVGENGSTGECVEERDFRSDGSTTEESVSVQSGRSSAGSTESQAGFMNNSNSEISSTDLLHTGSAPVALVEYDETDLPVETSAPVKTDAPFKTDLPVEIDSSVKTDLPAKTDLPVETDLTVVPVALLDNGIPETRCKETDV